jgi:alpha-L-rhamnosidase
MCGINIAGERHFRIEPRVGGSLTFAECSYDSVYGRISSSWHRTKEETVYEISVPSNTTATFILDSEEHILTPGCHTFRTTCNK